MSISVDKCVQAYCRGKLEYIQGLGVEANPFRGSSVHAAFWNRGWLDQELESSEVCVVSSDPLARGGEG